MGQCHSNWCEHVKSLEESEFNVHILILMQCYKTQNKGVEMLGISLLCTQRFGKHEACRGKEVLYAVLIRDSNALMGHRIILLSAHVC